METGTSQGPRTVANGHEVEAEADEQAAGVDGDDADVVAVDATGGALCIGASGGVEWILVFAIQCVNAGSATVGFPGCEVWCQLRDGFALAREV